MYCDNCGCELGNDTRKCPVCGKEFPSVNPPADQGMLTEQSNNQNIQEQLHGAFNAQPGTQPAQQSTPGVQQSTPGTQQSAPGTQQSVPNTQQSVPNTQQSVQPSPLQPIAPDADIMIKKKGEKKERSKGAKACLIALPIIVVIAVVLFAVFFVPKFKKYNSAAEKLAKGEVEQAVELYKELGTFKDSFDLANGAAYYDYAKSLEKDGRNLEAAEYYKKAANSMKATEGTEEAKDSRYTVDDAYDKSNQCYYNAGMDQMNAGSFDAAIEAFKNAGTYKDADDKVIECTYKKAQSLMVAEDYDGAINLLSTIEDYSDSKELLSQCYYKKGEVLEKEKKYDEAYDMYVKSEYSDYKNRANDCIYGKAVDFFNNKDYSNALKNFDKVDSTYKDCTVYKDSCYTYLAAEAFDNKDYVLAIDYYLNVQKTDMSDKIVKAKLEYIKANKNAANELAMTYLGELRYAGNKTAQKLFADIVKWDIESFVNTNELDMEKKLNVISVKDDEDIYIHTTYAFEGKDSMNISGYVVYADGNKSGKISFEDAVVDGWSTWIKIEGDKVPKGVTYLYIQNDVTNNFMEVYPFTIK